MESLLGSYRREKSRVKKSMITGSGRDDVYRSTWYAYDCFAFLGDRHDPGGTRETLNKDETDTNVITVHNQSLVPTDSDDIRVVDHTTGTQLEGTQPTQQHDTQAGSDNRTENPQPQTTKKRSKKRTAKELDDISDDTINEAYKLLQHCAASESSQSTTQTQSDTYSSFGLYIANELGKYDPLTLAHVKNDICQIIFRADTGAYQRYGYFTKSYSNYDVLSNSSYSNPSPSSSSYSYTPVPTPSPLPPQSSEQPRQIPIPPPPPPPPFSPINSPPTEEPLF